MSKNLGKAEQALYERLRMGPLNAGESLFFSRQIGGLIAAKIAKRTADGGLELVNPASYVTQPPLAPMSQPPGPSQSGTMPAVMPTVTARVPQEAIDALDALGLESRGAALRAALGEWMASQRPGLRKTGGGR